MRDVTGLFHCTGSGSRRLDIGTKKDALVDVYDYQQRPALIRSVENEQTVNKH